MRFLPLLLLIASLNVLAQPEFISTISGTAHSYAICKGNLFFKTSDSLWVTDSLSGETFPFHKQVSGNFLSIANTLLLVDSNKIHLVEYPDVKISTIGEIRRAICFYEFQDQIYFYGSDSAYGLELRRLTRDSIYLVKDINPGLADGIPEKQGLWSFSPGLQATDSLLFFAATDGQTGVELWVSDGTDAGTRQVVDQTDSAVSVLYPIITDDKFAYYFQNNQLFRSDGSITGTVFLDRFPIIGPGAYPVGRTAVLSMILFEGKVCVVGTDDYGTNKSLYIFENGKTPQLLSDGYGDDNSLVNFFELNGRLFCQYYWGGYRNLQVVDWRTFMLKNVSLKIEGFGVYIKAIPVGDVLLYVNELDWETGSELIQVDPDNLQSERVADLYPDFTLDFRNVREFIPSHDYIYFTTYEYKDTTKGLWRYKPGRSLIQNKISELENFVLKYYPNPVTDELYVESLGGKIQSWTLFSVSGQRLLDGIGQNEFGLNVKLGQNIPSGVYFLQVNIKDDGVKMLRVSKK